jgi:hypothetical protein
LKKKQTRDQVNEVMMLVNLDSMPPEDRQVFLAAQREVNVNYYLEKE